VLTPLPALQLRQGAGTNVAGAPNLCVLVQGLALGAFGLIGGLSLVAHLIPQFWVGHWWGMFVSAPLLLFIWGTTHFMVLIEQRHNRAWPFKRAELVAHN
jgi:hypothetical protein